jgi:hypothetical protein
MRCSSWFVALALTATLLTTHNAGAVEWAGLKPGNVELKSAGPMTFGPDRVLFVGDTAAATVYAIKTGDGTSDTSKVP